MSSESFPYEMKSLLNRIRWLWFVALMALFGLSLATISPGMAVSVIAYDGQTQLTTVYDAPSASLIDYDAARKHTADETGNAATANRAFFAYSVEFLAAKTAAGAGDEMVTVFRGVGGNHPGFQNAIQGKAVPFGGHADAALRNAFDTRSIFTSWTTDYSTAVRFGLADGPGGVVLRQSVPRSSLILSPDKYLEFEVLRSGPISGATPIILSP